MATRYKADVDRYLIWNEPNQKGWLQPQWEKVAASLEPVSPHIYRALVRAAQPAVKAADPGAEIVIGELAPVGNKPISARHADAARCRSCARWAASTTSTRRSRPAAARASRRPRATRSATTRTRRSCAPDSVNPDVDAAQFGDLQRLFTAIDKLRARKRDQQVGKTST